jgi:hypothetical protein
MSLSLALATILPADLALIGVLAFAMSRAKLLTPHASATPVLATASSAARTTHLGRKATRTPSAVLTARA